MFKNKFFLICLCVAIVLSVIPSTLSLMGYRSLSRNIIGTVMTPGRWIVSAIGNGFEGLGIYFSTVSALKEKNEALEEENESMKSENERAKILEEENKRLRSYLGIKQEYPSFTMEEGMIISREAGNYITVLTLNRGSIHGISENMPVIVESGIVGCVTEVGLTWCKVSTLLESAVSVGAYLPRTGATGITVGDYSLRDTGLIEVRYIDSQFDVQPGDVVLSSGIGSVYPPELTIGTVTAVSVDTLSRSVVATVRPSVDYENLQYMLIITGYQKGE